MLSNYCFFSGIHLRAQYLEKQPNLISSKRVLELGAGIGLVGIAAGVLGAKEVLLTDLPYALPNMRENVRRNARLLQEAGCMNVICSACDWYNPPSLEELGAAVTATNAYNGSSTNQGDSHCEPPQDATQKLSWIPDIILIADCVWMQELVAPLLATLKHFILSAEKASPFKKRPEILISYQRRGKSTHEEFWSGLHTSFDATVEEIDVSSVGLTKPESIYLLSLK